MLLMELTLDDYEDPGDVNDIETPEEATSYFYELSKNSDYIRTYRVARDRKWICNTTYCVWKMRGMPEKLIIRKDKIIELFQFK